MSQVPANQTTSADYVQAEEFRVYIEREVLVLIQEIVIKGTTDKDRVQAIAREVLTLIHKGMSIEEMYINAIKMDDKYTELGPVVIKLMKEYEGKYNKKAVAEVSQLIKQGNYDAAQNMVMKVLMYKGV